MNNHATEITICMGSSCFSRGNGKNHATIKKFVEENDIAALVSIKGCRCGGRCLEGPNIWIGDRLITNVDHGSIIDILKSEFGKS